MEYNIAISMNLKNLSNHLELENLIYDCGNNCNSTNIYNDYELQGINKYIKKNNKIIILDFEEEDDLINFLIFIKNQIQDMTQNITIDYIYINNDIIYGTKKYLNSISNTLFDKNLLLDKISKNKLNSSYKKIINLLK
jgi:hypothetical protein